jgi:flavin-dependent dehydrogenase
MLTKIDFARRYDVLVVGARCAGAATAMLLARAGARVLMVDWAQPGTDTLSTHALMRGGVMQLRTWGLLDRIAAAETPAVQRTSFAYGDEEIDLDIKPAHGVDALYAPRRTLLDRTLVEAAMHAGVDVRFVVGVVGLRRDGTGRVIGADLNVGEEFTVPVEAGLVIGADGRHSSVARLAGARVQRESKHASAAAYAYVGGLQNRGYRWCYRAGISAGLIPTNDGLHCVFVSVPPDRYHTQMRGRFAAGLLEGLAEAAPDLGALVAGAPIQGRVIGFAGQKGHMRQAFGPGWALVGDAGYFKDPITAHGITDALRDADILSRAVLAGGETALAEYQSARDLLSGELFAVTDEIAGFGWDLERLKSLHMRLNKAMKAEQDWMSENVAQLRAAA